MHNTMESCCYKKYGTTTWGTFGQAQRKPDKDRNSKKSYMQVLTQMEKLEMTLKKANKKGRKCHCCEENDNNTNSS